MSARIRRLAIVSTVALGIIWWLARRDGLAAPATDAALFAGWLLMPATLLLGLRERRSLPLVAVPSTLVTLGLLAVSVASMSDGNASSAGWLLVLTGVLMGDALGAWLWFGYLPVPQAFRDPHALGRLLLIAAHVALILGGLAVVVLAV